VSQKAALENLDAPWHGILDKMGMQVVIVQFDTRLGSPIHSHPKLAESLGMELREVQAGHYDSTFYLQGSKWCFFHCRDLGRAMQRLKAQLEVRGLLPIVNILHAEESNQLRIWYSPDPDAIGRLVEG
jgi:hypothetical protein